MQPIKEYINHPRVLFTSLLRDYGGWIPDKQYLQMMYYLKMGKLLNLKNPQTFSEKLQWLKLYNRRPEYTMMVDKYAVKNYVTGIIGEEYVIPTLGVWDRPEDIDFDILPNQFVLKTTHGGGGSGVVICKDKTSFDKDTAIEKLKRAMKQDIYRKLREWPYSRVVPRIIAEQFLSNCGKDLNDYKYFCFNGEPKYCQVIGNRSVMTTIDFYDIQWHLQPFQEPKEYSHANQIIECPHNIEGMLSLCRKLANSHPFLRVDLYESMNRVYFSELTFFPTSGFGMFSPACYDKLFGDLINLPLQ